MNRSLIEDAVRCQRSLESHRGMQYAFHPLADDDAGSEGRTRTRLSGLPHHSLDAEAGTLWPLHQAGRCRQYDQAGEVSSPLLSSTASFSAPFSAAAKSLSRTICRSNHRGLTVARSSP